MPPARRSARTASSTAARDATGPYTTRANRQPSSASSRPTASITRGANGSSLKLKVRAPSSKLKQVTGAGDGAIPPNPYADLSESDATPQPASRTARQTRNPRTVVEPDTDEDEDEDEEMEDAEGDEPEEGVEMEEDEGEDDLDENDDSEDDAEGEEDDEDELASDPPPPPIIRQERPLGKGKPNVTVTAPPEGPIKSVEAKEMEDEEDEELSELDSNPDAEGDEDEEDDESDQDPDNSRSATPDLTKLTKRQRAAHGEAEAAGLMELSNEALKKKHLTAEEQVMRRTEMARRRKNLSEKRNEEEKMDTINKLLKKPAPKRRTRAEIIAQQQADMMATPGAEDGEQERPDPLFARWVSSAQGSRLGVPEEWMEGGGGDVSRGGNSGSGGGRMVEEVA